MWPKVTNQMDFRSDKTHEVTRCKQALTAFTLPSSKSTDMIVKGQKTELQVLGIVLKKKKKGIFLFSDKRSACN